MLLYLDFLTLDLLDMCRYMHLLEFSVLRFSHDESSSLVSSLTWSGTMEATVAPSS